MFLLYDLKNNTNNFHCVRVTNKPQGLSNAADKHSWYSFSYWYHELGDTTDLAGLHFRVR